LICWTPAWNTHEAWLVVIIVVQSSVGIGYSFEDTRRLMLCEFGLKMPIYSAFWTFGLIRKQKRFAVLSLYECNNLRLMSYESNRIKIASAV